MQDKVQEFHDAFGIYTPSHSTLTPFNDQTKDTALHDLRINLIEEEFNELKDAIAENNIVEVADALGDIMVVVLGTACSFGIDMTPVFNEIHRSNMSKLGEDGKPIYRADGKVLKGPNYSPPNIKAILNV